MMKMLLFAVSAAVSISVTVEARGFNDSYTQSGYSEIRGRNNDFGNRNRGNEHRDSHPIPNRKGGFDQPGSGTPANDADIVRAVESRRHANYVQGGGMVVSEILPDDNKGLRHQKFVVQLSNGSKMLAVYNLDMQGCRPVPVQKGDTVAMGGEFKWTQQGALLHWLHYDPSGRRPDGYVQHDGVDYCRSGR